MKIKEVARTDEELEQFNNRDKLEIYIDDDIVFSVEDDEPEDSTLCRSFSDCFGIIELMKLAYHAGKSGEELIIE